MKQLIVLVGPPGSGKSTWAKANHPDYTRISQDDMGSKGHLDAFAKAIKAVDNILIDRMNHTRSQRARYILDAKEAGYTVIIKEFFENYRTCFDRITSREGHPTIPVGDAKTARSALDTYFNQYETIQDWEGDVILRTNRNPVAWDMTEYIQKEGIVQTTILGDIHGCFSDVKNILNELSVEDNFTSDLVIACGDLVDRGPQIKETLEYFFYKNIKTHRISVRGNHDDKFIRWLRGNKVNTESLQQTIEQTKDMDKDDLYMRMMNMPYVITFGKYAVTHAGFHPEYSPEHNSREFAMYVRKYDPTIRTFTNDNTKPYWYEFERKDDKVLFFGHEIHPDISQVKPNVYALDGGCYMGGKMRAAVIINDRVGIVEEESSQPKIEKEITWDHINKFEPYDKLVEQGYLNKQEQGDLILYNYTDKCTYDKMWNKYTMESRGLILNKVTGDTVARPFPKFFNLGENQDTILSKMPNESYECFEKLDGSLGILYQDPADNEWKIATRGSFNSEQAKRATEMFKRVCHHSHDFEYIVTHSDKWNDLKDLHDYTLLFEIIYPENRVNPGARLVVDYGSKETLVLLGAIHKVTGKDLDRDNLAMVSFLIGLPIAKKFDYTIEQMIALQKTLPVTEEGFVVKYASGFRVKIKGQEYCKMQRILNSITPIFLWEIMQEDPEFKLNDHYMMSIPEELLPEVNEIQAKLHYEYKKVRTLIHQKYTEWKLQTPGYIDLDEKQKLKSLGLFSQEPINNVKYPGILFAWHNQKFDQVKKSIIKLIRPTGNVIGGKE